jgi:hypothetical protein
MTPRTKFGLLALVSTPLIGATPIANANSIKGYTVPLSATAVLNVAHPTGGTGDPYGSGLVMLVVDPNAKLVCYSFNITVTDEPMMAHIHVGAPSQLGAPVVTLFTGTRSRLKDCAPSTHSQLAEINANPSNYYVSVDTTGYPDGALRGQL